MRSGWVTCDLSAWFKEIVTCVSWGFMPCTTSWSWIIAGLTHDLQSVFCLPQSLLQMLDSHKVIQQIIDIVSYHRAAMMSVACLLVSSILPAWMTVTMVVFSRLGLFCQSWLLLRLLMMVSPLVSSKWFNQTWTISRWSGLLSLLKAVNDISHVDRPVLLGLLGGPSLDSDLLQILLFEWAQELSDLLLYLIVWRFLVFHPQTIIC